MIQRLVQKVTGATDQCIADNYPEHRRKRDCINVPCPGGSVRRNEMECTQCVVGATVWGSVAACGVAAMAATCATAKASGPAAVAYGASHVSHATCPHAVNCHVGEPQALAAVGLSGLGSLASCFEEEDDKTFHRRDNCMQKYEVAH